MAFAGTVNERSRQPVVVDHFQRQAVDRDVPFGCQPGIGPTIYPVACAPQAWASATPFALLQACLGIQFDHAANEIRFLRPWLPRFLDELVIRSLRLGETRVDVLLRRYEDDVSVNVLGRNDGVAVTVTY